MPACHDHSADLVEPTAAGAAGHLSVSSRAKSISRQAAGENQIGDESTCQEGYRVERWRDLLSRQQISEASAVVFARAVEDHSTRWHVHTHGKGLGCKQNLMKN
jgi:hypothetical protein